MWSRVKVTSLCAAWALDLETEHAQSSSLGMEVYRSTASGGIAIDLSLNGWLMWHFSTGTSCDVIVMDIRYSNDGFSDTVELQVDGSIIGQFRTLGVSQEGTLWNVFRSSGVVDNPVTLSAGQHTLKLIVKMADAHRVDIDKVILSGSCVGGSSTTQTYDVSTNTPSPNTITLASDGITGLTGDGSAGPTDLTPAEIAGIVIPVIGLVISAIGGTIAAYKCYMKHCDATPKIPYCPSWKWYGIRFAVGVVAIAVLIGVMRLNPDVINYFTSIGPTVPHNNRVSPGDFTPTTKGPPVDCHKISNKQELGRAMATIGNWEMLCENLGVPEPVLIQLRFANMENEMKRSRCLEAYLNTGKACWETVVQVVADDPFYNKKLAEKIANDYGVDYSSIVKEEL